MAGALLVFFAALYPLRGYFFPVGPDTPVYLWWTNLAAVDGLSANGLRPGVPDLVLVLSGTLRLSRVEVLAGLGAAGGVGVGLASGVLAGLAGNSPDGDVGVRRVQAVLAGVLAGTFAVHLADGFFANLLQAGLFLGAAAALACMAPGGVVAGAALLSASALTHPLFFLLSIGILAIAALPTLVRRQPGQGVMDVDGGRVLAAIAGGGALAGLGFAAQLAGPSPPHVDTSQDAFLRRAGLNGLLRKEYRGRFLRHLARYVLPAQIPLGISGLVETARSAGFVAQFLATWAAVLVLGVIFSILSNLVPAVRFFAFGYVLPILAAIGLVSVHRAIARRRRTLAAALVLGLAVAIVLGATFTWLRARPFLSRTELERAAVAGRIAQQVPGGTPLVFVVENARRNVSFLATRAGNVIRDALPPERIRDVHLYIGSPGRYLRGEPTALGPIPHDTMSRLYLRDIQRAGGEPLAFVLAPFNRSFFDRARTEGDLLSRGVIVLDPHPALTAPSPGPAADVPPSSGWKLAFSCLATLALLVAVGWGWSASTISGPTSLALAPAFGAAALILGGFGFERLGGPLTGWGPWIVSAGAGGCGYLALAYRRRGPLAGQADASGEPPPQISQ